MIKACVDCRFWKRKLFPEYYGDKYHYEELQVKDYNGICRLLSFDLFSQEKKTLNAPTPKAITVDLDEGTIAELYTSHDFWCRHFNLIE